MSEIIDHTIEFNCYYIQDDSPTDLICNPATRKWNHPRGTKVFCKAESSAQATTTPGMARQFNRPAAFVRTSSSLTLESPLNDHQMWRFASKVPFTA